MPWTGPQFASRHNHSLDPARAAHAARIGNAILRRGVPEGVAIATANKLVEHRDAGGGVDPTQGGVGGVTPSAQTMNPLAQGLIQRYASLPPEKLQELAARMGGSPQGQMIRQVLQRKLIQPNAQQAPAQAPQAPGQVPAAINPAAQPPMRRGGGIPRRDMGGGLGMSLSQADPWWTRREAASADQSSSGGFLAGTTGGRADTVKTTAPGGAYVLPADVVAGLGDGNSLAGARVWDEILRSGPRGIPLERGARGMGPPRAPSVGRGEGWLKGGGVHGQPARPTPVALSHGEIVVAPEHVAMIGGGDIHKGHDKLDQFVLAVRRRYTKHLTQLKPPVGSKAA